MGNKIVIVEDSKAISTVLKEVLEAEGHTVKNASDGVNGLAMIRREKPDLVLLDLLLPKLNGYDVCKAVMMDGRTRHIPVLIMSTLDTPESRMKLQASGARHFMKKPYQLDDLLNKIHQLLPNRPQDKN